MTNTATISFKEALSFTPEEIVKMADKEKMALFQCLIENMPVEKRQSALNAINSVAERARTSALPHQ